MKTVEARFPSLSFAIFAVGDSAYHATYNMGCRSVLLMLEKRKLRPLMMNCMTEADVALENPPYTDFRNWSCRVERALDGETDETQVESGKKEQIIALYEKQYQILKAYQEATLRFDSSSHKPGKILKLSLERTEFEYSTMGHIHLLPRNSKASVQQVMTLLGFNGNETIGTVCNNRMADRDKVFDETQVQLFAILIRRYLEDFVDLYSPFASLSWATSISKVTDEPAVQILEKVSHLLPAVSLKEVLFSMAPMHPRSYSTASSPADRFDSICQASTLDLLVRIIPDGRFSNRCLSEIGNGGQILYKLTPNIICRPLLTLDGKPLIAVACGTGVAPIRSLLQYLIRTNTESKVSLFIGFRPNDSSTELFIEVIEQASDKGILDILYVVPSNKEKMRVQDHSGDCEEALRHKLGDQEGYFYVCGNAKVVSGAKEKLERILGLEMWKKVQMRILEETF